MVGRKRLGSTDMQITPIGFGTWALGGGDWAFGWGDQDDAESIAAIRRAVDLGINWVDTAAVYGLGRAEEVVSKALGEIPSTAKPYVFTKCSLVWDKKRRISHSLKAESVKREVEDSLRRLKVETIDLYQIHWPTVPPGPAPDIEEGWSTLVDLQREGKVRYIGVSNFDVGQLERIRAIAPVDSLQPPYSMIERGIETEVLPYCLEHDIGVIIYSPLQSGLLSGAMTRERIASLPKNDWRASKSPDFQEPNLTRNMELVEFLREVGERCDRSPAEVAISWTLRHPAVTGAIVGGRRPLQVDGFIGAMEFRLTDAEINEIDSHLSQSAG
jgi:aryl-alcohol dehydrogenase-like predicted oxidoreductase